MWSGVVAPDCSRVSFLSKFEQQKFLLIRVWGCWLAASTATRSAFWSERTNHLRLLRTAFLGSDCLRCGVDNSELSATHVAQLGIVAARDREVPPDATPSWISATWPAYALAKFGYPNQGMPTPRLLRIGRYGDDSNGQRIIRLSAAARHILPCGSQWSSPKLRGTYSMLARQSGSYPYQ